MTPGFYWATNPGTMTRWIVVEVADEGDETVAYLPGSDRPVRGAAFEMLTFGPRVEMPGDEHRDPPEAGRSGP